MGKIIFKRTVKQELNRRITSKKRKLNEIRASKLIKNGLSFFSTFKVPAELLNSDELIHIIEKQKVKIHSPRLHRKFNKKMIKTNVEFGQVDNDFIKNLYSIRITYKYNEL